MALRFFVTVDGTKTGVFKGESQQRGHDGQVEGIAFRHGLNLPYHPAAGQATGTAPWR